VAVDECPFLSGYSTPQRIRSVLFFMPIISFTFADMYEEKENDRE